MKLKCIEWDLENVQGYIKFGTNLESLINSQKKVIANPNPNQTLLFSHCLSLISSHPIGDCKV